MPRAILIAFKADQVAAEAIASELDENEMPRYPGGAGSFGPGCSKWHTAPNTPVLDCTQLAISGNMDAAMIERFRMSSVPKFQVIDNPDDVPPWDLLAQCNPPLFRGIDDEVV